MKVNIKKGRETVKSYNSNIDNGYEHRTKQVNSEVKVRVVDPRNRVNNKVHFANKNKYQKKNVKLDTSMINHFDDNKEKDPVKEPFNTKSKFLSEEDNSVKEKSDREIYEEMKKKEEQDKVQESIRKSIDENINKAKDETSATKEDSLMDKLNKYDEEYGDLEGGLQPMKKKRNIRDEY